MVHSPWNEYDEYTVATCNRVLDHLAVVGCSRNDGNAPVEAVELPNTLFPAHPDNLIAAIERVLHQIPPKLPRGSDDADLHRLLPHRVGPQIT